jgi:hypothetical protein
MLTEAKGARDLETAINHFFDNPNRYDSVRWPAFSEGDMRLTRIETHDAWDLHAFSTDRNGETVSENPSLLTGISCSPALMILSLSDRIV